MNYIANEGKKIDIDINGKIYKRHVIKIPVTELNSDIYSIVKEHVLPVYKQGDILYISKNFASICTDNHIYTYDIKVSNLAKKLAIKIRLLPKLSPLMNIYAMQVAIDIAGIPNMIYANMFYGNGPKEDFIKATSKRIDFITGLDGTYFKDYSSIVIVPPVNANEICHNIRKNMGMTCFIASNNPSHGTFIHGLSRDLKLPITTIERMISDNPLCDEDQCTPFCIIRDESYVAPPQIIENNN